MLRKNSLINLLRKFQLQLHSWSITINTQTNFQIISQYRIFCETCPNLVQNAILWNNAPTWLNNILEPVRTKLHSGASKRSLRRCQTLKRSNELLKDSKLLTRSKMNWYREDRILSRTSWFWKIGGRRSILSRRLPNALVTARSQHAGDPNRVTIDQRPLLQRKYHDGYKWRESVCPSFPRTVALPNGCMIFFQKILNCILNVLRKDFWVLEERIRSRIGRAGC